MSVFTKMANGWELAISSLRVLNANKQLIIFPILSGISMILITGSIGWALFSNAPWTAGNLQLNRGMLYVCLFGYYLVNYFVVVFFNMALIHCSKVYFDGGEVSVSRGLQFSMSRVRVIFLWAAFSATVGTVLRILQDNLGWLGKIITGVIGIVWSIATFLAVPVLAYENVGPVAAAKRSAQLVRQKWGEGIGASFSFGLMFVAAFLVWGIFSYAVSYYVSDIAGIALFGIGFLLMLTVSSALHSIFISALYNNINGNINSHFRQQLLDSLFEPKS